MFSAYFETLKFVGRIVKNHLLTALVFGQVFRPQKLSQILL